MSPIYLKDTPPFPAVDSDRSSGDSPDYDVHIITSGGLRIPAHASVLVMNRFDYYSIIAGK